MGEIERMWVEEMLSWCATQFGPRTLRTPVILPTSDFFPDAYSGSEPEVRALVERVSGYMGVRRDRVVVEVDTDGDVLPDDVAFLEGSSHGEAGHYRLERGRAVVFPGPPRLAIPATRLPVAADVRVRAEIGIHHRISTVVVTPSKDDAR
ncbi:hypothetical protein [Nocardia amikacinitolerans]|uniref:hypothetical protein n=1 Tax=Nocardia amikacinitolerans TaxID=756689 RepID=UPI0020A2AA89|nr:hypothetical protein [Nocardia amikacinitolerans]MCP2279474.1 hypothetical protein [Nocardia amikacinitolerans]MCP2296729.1 hypothetical protein [Nocardia amikacinitolerans]